MQLSVACSRVVALLHLVGLAACGGSACSTMSGPAGDSKRASPTAASPRGDRTVVPKPGSSFLVPSSGSPPTPTRSSASDAPISVTTTVPTASTASLTPTLTPWRVVLATACDDDPDVNAVADSLAHDYLTLKQRHAPSPIGAACDRAVIIEL